MAIETPQQHVPIWFYALNLFDDMFKPIADRREAAYDRTMRKYEADTQAFNFMVMLQNMMKSYHDAQIEHNKDVIQWEKDSLSNERGFSTQAVENLSKSLAKDSTGRTYMENDLKEYVYSGMLNVSDISYGENGDIVVKYNDNKNNPFVDITITPTKDYQGNPTANVTYKIADGAPATLGAMTRKHDNSRTMFDQHTANALVIHAYNGIAQTIDNYFNKRNNDLTHEMYKSQFGLSNKYLDEMRKLQEEQRSHQTQRMKGTWGGN